MAAGELLVRTHVEHQRLAGVELGGQLAAVQAAPAAPRLAGQQQGEQHHEQRAEYIVVRDKFNQLGNHRKHPAR
ncbi:hypothetical protein D3C81_1311050 [compost metagenome]